MKRLLKILAGLPLRAQYLLSRVIAAFLPWLSPKSHQVVVRNLQLCFPDQTPKQLKALCKAYYKHNAQLFFEVASVWTQPADQLVEKITHVEGETLLTNETGPLIIALPHLGNWELIWPWLCRHKTPMAMYSPAKRQKMDQLVYEARTRIGGEVCATDSKGLLALLKGVRQGKVLVILPDQVPTKGSGIFTPFYGRPAYTMTLLHKLAQKSKAKVLLGACVRREKFFDYQLILQNCGACHWQQDVESFNLHLNQAIESLINQYPDQYQWNYKRFKRQPDGSRLYDENKRA